MIVGVSHIVLGSSDLEADRRRFESYGYEIVFSERDRPVHPAKRPFLGATGKVESFDYLRPSRGLSIELVRYGSVLEEAPSPLGLVVESDPPAGFRPIAAPGELVRAWSEAVDLPLPAVSWEEDLRTALYFGGRRSNPLPVLHTVPDCASTTAAWTDLGFRPVSRGEGWSLLVMSSPMPRWSASLLVVETAMPRPTPRLDPAGFRCLSLVTTDLAQDAPRARGRQPPSTGPMDMVVNSRNIRLEMFAGPGGIVLELLQFLPGRPAAAK